MTSLDDDLTQRLLVQLDRADATDTLYRYCSTIDRRDMVGLRATMADDIRARYGNADWIEGADDLVKWIDSASADTLWQHHLISVYHVDIDGDRAACPQLPHLASAVRQRSRDGAGHHRQVPRPSGPYRRQAGRSARRSWKCCGPESAGTLAAGSRRSAAAGRPCDRSWIRLSVTGRHRHSMNSSISGADLALVEVADQPDVLLHTTSGPWPGGRRRWPGPHRRGRGRCRSRRLGDRR